MMLANQDTKTRWSDAMISTTPRSEIMVNHSPGSLPYQSICVVLWAKSRAYSSGFRVAAGRICSANSL